MKYSVDKDGYVVATGRWPKSRLGALKESIKKWEWLAKHRGSPPYTDSETCALCNIYILGDKNNCTGCPVMERTGEKSCVGTPYYDYSMALGHKKAKLAARAEVKFLKSLLPKQAVAKG